MEIIIMNMFFLRVLFFVIFLFKFMFLRKMFWYLLKKLIFKGKFQVIKKNYKNEIVNIGSEYVVFIKYKMSFVC